jgi:hypothetical protein
MSLRLRYYLAILPLFLGLGLINSVLVYYTERNELHWGLRERAQGAAAAVAGFWDVIASGPADSPATRLKGYSQRLGALSISRFERDAGRWVQRTLHESTDVPQPPLPDAEVDAALAAGPLAWKLLETTQEAGDLSIGYALVAGAEPAALIGVAERDLGLRNALANLRMRLAGLLLGLLLAGVVVAEMITRIASRELGALTRAARDAAQGRFLSHWPDGRIRELNDLGGTLLTMTSLLADDSHQTRRRFFQHEPLPGEAELAGAYRAQFEPSLPVAIGHAHCASRRIGAPMPEDFCGWRAAAGGWYLTVGRCRLPEDDRGLLARMVRAEAARDFFLGVAISRPHGPAWPEALKVYPCTALQMVFVPASGQAATGWSLDPIRGLPQPWSSEESRVVIGTLSIDARQIGQAYARQFPDRQIDQIADELSSLLGSRHQGLLVICDFQSSSA